MRGAALTPDRDGGGGTPTPRTAADYPPTVIRLHRPSPAAETTDAQSGDKMEETIVTQRGDSHRRRHSLRN